MLAGYLLVFLTPDHLVSNNYAEMTEETLAWFESELARKPAIPTIVFFHAPLRGTYRSEKVAQATTPDSYDAEPAGRIREILLKNPQVFLWVAGHLHLAPPCRSFASSINVYENRVRVIHNADWDGDSLFSDDATKATCHDTIWTNSLFLHASRVVVRTYDHKQGRWLAELDRTIGVP
jgi:3',5'-cyclic-AMP phosphodiesterase